MCVLSRSVISNSLWPSSLLGSSVPGIFHARILEWVAISYSRGSFSIVSIVYTGQFQSPNSSHSSLSPWYPYFWSLHLCLYFHHSNKIIYTIFLDSTYVLIYIICANFLMDGYKRPLFFDTSINFWGSSLKRTHLNRHNKWSMQEYAYVPLMMSTSVEIHYW